MRIFFFFSFPLLFILLFRYDLNALAQEEMADKERKNDFNSSSKTFVMAILGSDNKKGEMPDFYFQAKDFMNEMEEFHLEHLFSFYGDSKWGVSYKKLDLSGLSEKFAREKNDFINTGGLCNIEDLSYFAHMTGLLGPFSQGPYEVLRYKGEEIRDETLHGPLARSYTGPSKKILVMDKLAKILEESQEGSHVFISFFGHGLKISNSNWQVALGEEGEVLTSQDLKPFVLSLAKKKAILHLNALSCYSGGFVKELSTYSDSPTCVLASAHRNSIGYSSHPESDPFFSTKSYDHHLQVALGYFGNQLKAHSCALAQDFLNRPNTSLDQLILDYDFNHVSMNVDVSEQISEYNMSETNEVAILREELLASYKEYVLDVYDECSEVVDQKILMQDISFLKASNECYERRCTSEVKNSYSKEGIACYYLEEFYKFVSQETGTAYREMLKEKTIEFFRKAPLEKLREYKNSFCCLSYNFKERKESDFCLK